MRNRFRLAVLGMAILCWACCAAAQSSLRSSLSGKISNAPQNGVFVKLKAVDKDPLALYAGYSTQAAADGSFQFEDVIPGKYVLIGEAAGFLATEYGAERNEKNASEIELKAGEKRKGLAFALTPKHVVCGKVADENGNPLAKVEVYAFAHPKGLMWLTDGKYATTDENGNYSLPDLKAGEYFVWAGMSTWFNGGKEISQADAERLTNAEPVEVGQETSKECRENIRIGPRIGYHGFHVRGKLTDEKDLRGKDLVLSLLEVNRGGVTKVLPPAEQSIGGTQTESSFDLWGVPAGHYRLILSRGRFQADAQRYQPGFLILSSQEIEVGDGDANDVLVAAAPLASLGGEVKYEGIKTAAACPTREKTLLHLQKVDDGQFQRVEMGADGTFSFAQLALGTYEVQLKPVRRGSVYVKAMLLDGQPVQGREIKIATAGAHSLEVTLSANGALAAGHVAPGEFTEKYQMAGTHPKATVSGVVKGTSENAPWVKLWALRFNSEKSYEYSTKPGTDGSFRFENVDPGIYLLVTQGKDYALTEYGAAYPGLEGTPLTLRAGQQVKGLVLRATPKMPRLCGQVTDEDGRAFGNVLVMAARARANNTGGAVEAGETRGNSNGLGSAASVMIMSDGLERATTDSNGVYRFLDLKPGRYFLWTESLVLSQSGREWKRRWAYYPSAVSLEDAKAIEVSYEGDAGCGHNIRMRSAPEFHVRGRLAGPVPTTRGFDHFNVRMVETSSSGTTGRSAFGKMNEDGTFAFDGVGPGHYRMMISGRHGEAPEVWSGPFCSSFFYQLVGSREVVVDRADLDDVVVEQSFLSKVSGELRFEDIPKEWKALRLDEQKVTLTRADGLQMVECPQSAPVNSAGEFSFENVEDGVYDVGIELRGVQGDELYLKSIALNGNEIKGRKINLKTGETAKLAMAVSNAGGELDVRIAPSGPPAEEYDYDEPCEPKLPVFESVWLIPDVMEPGGMGIATSYPQGPGHAIVPRIPPGRYHAVAGENFNNSFHFGMWRNEDSTWGNTEFLKEMRALGTAVEVRPGEKKKLSVADATAKIQELLAKHKEAVIVGDHCAASCSIEGFWNGTESAEKQ